MPIQYISETSEKLIKEILEEYDIKPSKAKVIEMTLKRYLEAKQ